MKKILADKKILIAVILLAVTALLGIILGSVALGQGHGLLGTTAIDAKDLLGSNAPAEVDLAYFGGIFTLVIALIGSIVMFVLIFMGKLTDAKIAIIIAAVLLVVVFALGIAAVTAI